MALQRTHRVPVVLLALLTATLLFPGAFEEARVAVGSWLPHTVPAPPERAQATPDEERFRLLARVQTLEQRLAAFAAAESALHGARIVPARSAADPSAVEARVIHREISRTRRSFQIDAGEADGLAPGMPVMQGGSFVGVVTTVVANAARVLRVDDRSATTSVPVAILTSDAVEAASLRAQGVAQGTGDGRMRVSFLPQDAARPGDVVVTAAGARLVPEGWVLGVVESVADDDRDGEYEAVVVPMRDLDTIATVFVLRVQSTGLRTEAR